MAEEWGGELYRISRYMYTCACTHSNSLYIGIDIHIYIHVHVRMVFVFQVIFTFDDYSNRTKLHAKQL